MTKVSPDKKEALSKVFHDVRGALSVMRMNVDIFKLSPEYKKGETKAKTLVKNIDKQIGVIIKKLKEGEKAL